jgi:hypothetical protein
VEPARGNVDFLVPIHSIRTWDSPHDCDTPSWDQLEQIKANISAALDFMKIRTGGPGLPHQS